MDGTRLNRQFTARARTARATKEAGGLGIRSPPLRFTTRTSLYRGTSLSHTTEAGSSGQQAFKTTPPAHGKACRRSASFSGQRRRLHHEAGVGLVAVFAMIQTLLFLFGRDPNPDRVL